MAKGQGEGQRQSSIVPNAPKKGLFLFVFTIPTREYNKKKSA